MAPDSPVQGPTAEADDHPSEDRPPTDPLTEAPSEVASQLERLQAERDAAVAALDRDGRRRRRHARYRTVVVGILVTIFAVLLPLTATVGWAHNTVLNTDGWVRTVGPLASDPAVTAAISREVTNEVFTALDAQSQIAGALPPKAEFLAGPITNGAKGYVQSGVNRLLNTGQFQTLWVQANRFANEQVVKVLRGDTKALTTNNGQVVLNLVPLLNAALQQIEPFIAGVVGHAVTLPTLSGNELPAQACQRISAALERPLPATCGQIPLFPADKLTQAQRLVRAFDRLTILLLILTPVVAAVALWVSRRRRRTLLELTVGGMLGLVIFRRATWWLQSSLVSSGKPENKAARQAIVDQLTHAFFTISQWLLIGLAVVLLLTLLTGPYAWAERTRHYMADAGRWTRDLAVATVGQAREADSVAWVRSHMGALRIGGVVTAILVMLIFSVSFAGFVVVAVLLVAYELWLRRIEGQGPVSAPAVVDVTSGATEARTAKPDPSTSGDGSSGRVS